MKMAEMSMVININWTHSMKNMPSFPRSFIIPYRQDTGAHSVKGWMIFLNSCCWPYSVSLRPLWFAVLLNWVWGFCFFWALINKFELCLCTCPKYSLLVLVVLPTDYRVLVCGRYCACCLPQKLLISAGGFSLIICAWTRWPCKMTPVLWDKVRSSALIVGFSLQDCIVLHASGTSQGFKCL